MRGWSAPLAATLLFLIVAASGCTGDGGGQVQGIQNIPTDAPSEAGSGDFDVTVRVLAEFGGGAPVAQAGVLVYHIEKPVFPPTIPELVRGNATLSARTDAAGEAVFHLDASRTYSFVAGAPGFTVESRHLIKMAPGLDEVTIALFRSEMDIEIKGTLTTQVKPGKVPLVSHSYSEPLWFKQNVTFHENAAAQRQYVYRLADVEARLKWSNSPNGWADLGLRVEFSPETRWDMDRIAQTPADAQAEEVLVLGYAQLAAGSHKKDPNFLTGPYARDHIVAPNGLPYTINLHARFSTEPVVPAKVLAPFYTPGVGSVALLGALVAIAVALRRRGPDA